MLKKIVLAFGLLYFSSCFCLQSASRPQKKHNLSICAIFKNEGKYLKEWIEYHRIIGVDHFYLYNNNSVDFPGQILRSYINEKIVTLIPWPDYLGNVPEERIYMWSLSTQVFAYQHAIKLKQDETKWLLLLDVNEFLVPINQNLIEILEKYEEYPGIIVPTEYFDASEVNTLPKRKCIIESVEMTKTPNENIQKKVEKSIFKPDRCERFSWPPFKCVFKKDKAEFRIPKSEMKVNCYMNRSKAYHIRNGRGKIVLDPAVISETEMNDLLDAGYEMEERSIFRYVPQLLEKMKE